MSLGITEAPGKGGSGQSAVRRRCSQPAGVVIYCLLRLLRGARKAGWIVGLIEWNPSGKGLFSGPLPFSPACQAGGPTSQLCRWRERGGSTGRGGGGASLCARLACDGEPV